MKKLIPIGASSDGLVQVFEIDHDINDTVLYSFNNGPIERAKIEYKVPHGEIDEILDAELEPCLKVGSLVYFFGEIMRLTDNWNQDQWSEWKQQAKLRDEV